MSTERIAYRVVEAAEVLGLSRAKTYSLVAAGELPSVKLGGRLLVPAGALRERVNQLMAAGSDSALVVRGGEAA